MPTEPTLHESRGYEPPALVWLGPFGALTELTGGPFVDGPNPADTGPFSSSDRALKEAFAPIDAAAVLAGVVDLPIERWRYRGDGCEHIGPMAQDFAAAFGVGDDKRVIHNVDASGVALAAIQALAAEVADLKAQVSRLA